MNASDFLFMRQGRTLKPLSLPEANLLANVDIRQEETQRALLLLHGFSSTPAVYRNMIPKLISSYDAILCPALPGHATNLLEFGKTRSGEWLNAVESIGSQLLNHYEKVDVMGLSLGGVLACHLAGRFSLNHLYLLAPALSLRINTPFFLRLAKFVKRLNIKYLPNKAGNLYTDHEAEIAYRKLPLTAIIEVLSFIEQFNLQPFSCPIDLFLGRHDQVVHSSRVQERFSSYPHINTHWLEQSAHVLPLDGDIDAIIACVKNNRFFNRSCE